MIKIIPVEGKNVNVNIDGVKTKARKARVERNKRLLLNNMIVFDPKAYNTKKEFLMTSYDVKGEVVDKNRDFVDAMDYAEMYNPVVNIFNKKMYTKENKRK